MLLSILFPLLAFTDSFTLRPVSGLSFLDIYLFVPVSVPHRCCVMMKIMTITIERAAADVY